MLQAKNLQLFYICYYIYVIIAINYAFYETQLSVLKEFKLVNSALWKECKLVNPAINFERMQASELAIYLKRMHSSEPSYQPGRIAF